MNLKDISDEVATELKSNKFLHPDVLGAIAKALCVSLVVHEY